MKLKQTLYLIGLSYLIYKIYSPQTPVLHSHTEKEKDRKVSEKVVASRIGENRLSDVDTSKLEEICWEEMSG